MKVLRVVSIRYNRDGAGGDFRDSKKSVAEGVEEAGDLDSEGMKV
jgi:hypothetical protein